MPRSGENVDVLTISPILKQKNDNLEAALDPFIDLVLKKGKGRDLTISSIDSCNPWFNVSMFGPEMVKKELPSISNDWWNKNGFHTTGNSSRDVVEGVSGMSSSGDDDDELVVVGRLYHRIACGASSTARYKKPFTFNSLSFWSCAYELITNRAAMHRDGCGGIDGRDPGPPSSSLSSRASLAIEKLIKHQQQNDAGNAVTKQQLELWEDAGEAWAEYAEMGMNEMGTSLKPETPRQEGEGGGGNESSRLAMSELLVRSKLEPPQLLFGKYNEVVFEDVEVGEVAVGYVYVENPTGGEPAGGGYGGVGRYFRQASLKGLPRWSFPQSDTPFAWFFRLTHALYFIGTPSNPSLPPLPPPVPPARPRQPG